MAETLDDCMLYAKIVRADALHPYIGSLGYVLPKRVFSKMPVRVWNVEEPFFKRWKNTKKIHILTDINYMVQQILLQNVPEMYLGNKMD